MTTTNIYSGLDGDRNTSRVLAPPGGKSSNIFGGGDEDTPPQQVSRRGAGQCNPITGSAAAAASPGATASPAAKAQSSPAAQPPAQQQASSPAEPAQKAQSGRGGFNPITGEAYGNKEQDKPGSRVRNPPGGKSSGPLW